jgi:hypothetical protein
MKEVAYSATFCFHGIGALTRLKGLKPLPVKGEKMTHEDAGHYAAKHPAETQPDPQIARAVKKKVSDGGIACATAFKIASDLNVPPASVGVVIDLLEVRIEKCQLGLFGYSPGKRIVKPAENVSPRLAEAIKGSLVGNCLPCASSWEIAKKFGLAKMDVSAACEALKIKISSCQLGSFR